MPTKQSYPTTSHHLHMKLPSSYSSPSSSSAASYHLNSDAAAAAGCFSGILRRLVCNTLDVGSSSSSRSRVADAGTDGAVLQTAAAAEAPEKDHGISLKPPAPGIVARLMGLDSMPELPSAIGRSRSTGSLVLLPVPSTSHRRSHSFREAPTFLRPENDEFLLLSFSPENNGDETKKSPQPPPTPAPNHSMGLRQLDQRDAVEEETRERPSQTQRSAEKTTPTKQQQQQQKKKKTTTNAQRKTRERPSQTQRSAEKTPTKQQQKKKTTNAQRKTSREKTATHREAPERTRPTNKKKSSVSPKTMAAELDCSSQNSSPVSVLDRRLPELDGESLTDTSTPISDAEEEEEEEEEPRPEGSPRRKLSSPVDCFDDPSQFFHLILVDDKEGSISMATTDQERRDAAASLPPSSSHLWTEATRLAVGDAQRQPWKAQDPEELVAEFGLRILESLLLETVDEFCHLSSK